MNTNNVSRTLAVIGIIALSVSTVQAGHGQGGGGIRASGALECYIIQGESTGFVVDISQNDSSPYFTDRTGVGIGKSRLLCVSVNVDLVSRPDGTQFNSLPDGVPFAFQCHDIVSPTSNPTVQADVTSSADVGTFALQSGKYLCLPAAITDPLPLP